MMFFLFDVPVGMGHPIFGVWWFLAHYVQNWLKMFTTQKMEGQNEGIFEFGAGGNTTQPLVLSGPHTQI